MVYCAELGRMDPSEFLPEDFETWLVVLVVHSSL